MSIERKARVRWISAADGGRPSPPPGPAYSTVARFEVLADRWPQEAWSVVLEIGRPADDSGDMVVGIRTLAADAPGDLLAEGSRFDLFEGRRLVAHGKVL
jgi:hypothetical protein